MCHVEKGSDLGDCVRHKTHTLGNEAGVLWTDDQAKTLGFPILVKLNAEQVCRSCEMGNFRSLLRKTFILLAE